MKISYNWLKQYVDTGLDPEQVSTILTSIGLEVEGLDRVEAVRGGLEGVVVGKVLTCGKHPDADKLSVTTVDLGESYGEPLQIVCGAPNVAAGQKVLVATIGCTLYPAGESEGFKIKKSKIRGVESHGMICAEDELGLGTNHEGIMVLPENVKTGTPARNYFDIKDDYIFEIGLTPNRIDAGSHFGVARDLAAYLRSSGERVRLTLPSVDGVEPDNDNNAIEVEVENHEACPRYMGLTITGVRVAPSPAWLQDALRSIGLAPRNNVVDITNYMLHALGQPLHAFDAAKIEGGKVVVRTCLEGTKFTTLDGVERKLSSQDLMICSDHRPMCIAGVFGGLDSGVSESTRTIFLESAYFNPVWVRRTARRHGLNTDASFRYERGADPNMAPYALMRAAMLIKVIAGGEITSDLVDIYPNRIKPFAVDLSLRAMTRLVGKEIPRSMVKTILKSLDIVVKRESDDVLGLEVPPYRVDVTREADVIEEVLRIYGYNNIEIPQHVNSTLTYAPNPDRDRIREAVSDFLSACGYNEIMGNSLTKASYYDGNDRFHAENCVKILNPLSGDLSVMRQTLLYNALEAAQLNSNHRNGDLKLYELGNCYFYDSAKADLGGLAPYREEGHLSMLVTGLAMQPSWNVKGERSDFFTLKAMVERLLRKVGLNINDATVEPLQYDMYGQGVRYAFRNKPLLEMGILSKKLSSAFDMKGEVYYMEMNMDTLFALMASSRGVTVKELPKYPEVRRDLALLVDKGVDFARLREIAFAAERKLLVSVNLFDVYEGDKLPEGKKSYALNFVLRDSEATMTDAVTDKVMAKLVSQFEKQAGAQVRS